MKKVRILNIDDEAAVRISLTSYLEDYDFDVVDAQDGLDGWKKFQETAPDIVLCDLRMPGLNGIDLLRRVNDQSPDTPFIMISGAGVMSDVVNALRLGAWDYLLKPVNDLEIVKHTIDKCLERARLIQDNRLYRENLEKVNQQLQNNLALLEDDLRAGRNIQQRLLPEKEVKFGDLNLSHKILPSLYLSGDFIDYFRIDEKYSCCFIADVSGHGASSAFITVLLKNLMLQLQTIYREEKSITLLDPGQTLAFLNEEICRIKLDRHVTLFLAVYDHQGEKIRFSMAGHYPFPLFHSPGNSRFLTGQSLPIGILPGVRYQTQVIDAEKSFTLLVISDGLLEVLPGTGLPCKEQYLINHLHSSQDPSHIAKLLAIDASIRLPDDISLLLMQRSYNQP